MKMIRPLDCAKKIGVSRTTLHRWKKRPGFPVAFRLGDNSVAFDEDEIDQWLASRRVEPKAANVAAPARKQPVRTSRRLPDEEVAAH